MNAYAVADPDSCTRPAKVVAASQQAHVSDVLHEKDFTRRLWRPVQAERKTDKSGEKLLGR